MTSAYKQDHGNGIIVYADDYVKTGKWVFDCNNSRLISREPLPIPISELEKSGRLTIGDMYDLIGADREQAKAAIKAFTKVNGWHEKLHYLYSALNTSSSLNLHVFYLLGKHHDRSWALRVNQWIDGNNRSSFEITADPYDPETYIDYAKALQSAAKSCAVPQ